MVPRGIIHEYNYLVYNGGKKQLREVLEPRTVNVGAPLWALMLARGLDNPATPWELT